MTIITIADPSEGVPNVDNDTWSGYWSIQIEESDGFGNTELIANMNLHESALPSVEEPEEAAAAFEEAAEALRALSEHTDQEDGADEGE